MDEVVLPQRRLLVQYRSHTWQSAYIDDDGYLAELLASIVIGVPGVQRRGVTRSAGDLADQTEVKKGYRLHPNVDFLLSGNWNADSLLISLKDPPSELQSREIVAQLNANACSVQIVERDLDDRIVGCELAKTVSTGALLSDPSSGEHAIRLARNTRFTGIGPGDPVEFLLRQERGHINFGNKSASALDAILKSRPILVFYQHDMRGRMQVVVARVNLSNKERSRLIADIYGDEPLRRRQVQPYLMPDNERGRLARSAKHSAAVALRCRLLALGVESANGFDLQYWDPTGRRLLIDQEELLTQIAPLNECPNLVDPPIPLYLGDEVGRREASYRFFADCIDRYYQGLRPYCEATSTTRNIGFGNLSQHLVSARFGIRGTRSGARGADLIEDDGTPSEIKLATGQAGGDAMGTEDSPRLTLGWDKKKMLSWRRLIAVRIVDSGDGLRILLHAPDGATMATFASQVGRYFEGRLNTGSGGLQYHALDGFPHDGYGPVGRRLVFLRVADFESGKSPVFPEPVPEV